MTRPGWLESGALRVGLGCMRLWTEGAGDAAATITAAVDAGVTLFDTARAYDGPSGERAGNERHLARLLKECGAGRSVRIVTKGGMRRDGIAWIPDGRARTIAADCETSLAALDGFPIDLYLIHAPDPRTPWRTTVRALTRLLETGMVPHVGLSNITRAQLEEALDTAPIAAVEVSLSPLDAGRLKDGTVARAERGITVLAHSPLGGQRRAATLERRPVLRGIADRHGITAAEVALAWLLHLDPSTVAVAGARRPQTVRAMVHAATLRLDDAEHAALGDALGRPRAAHVERRPPRVGGDVVLVMGIPGAGKSRVAKEYVARGYGRLNRDLRGGSLHELCVALDDTLQRGARSVVLDNTWLTRALRSEVVEVATRHDIAVRCIWLDTPLAEAQRNLIARHLEQFGSLPTPAQLRRGSGDGMLSPTSQMRALRALEPPALDEGFTDVEHRPFARAHTDMAGASAAFIAAPAVTNRSVEAALNEQGFERYLVFDWRPDAEAGTLTPVVERITEWVRAPVDASLCPHPAGPPVCWCRPPLPGLILAFARQHGVDLTRSAVVGTSTAHRTMARVLGSHFVAADGDRDRTRPDPDPVGGVTQRRR